MIKLIDKVMNLVSESFMVAVEDMKAPGRSTTQVMRAKYAAIYIMRQQMNWIGLRYVAALFNIRTPGNISRASNLASSWMNEDQDYANKINEINNELNKRLK